MAEAQTLHDAFINELRDTYDAEKQLTKALPMLAKAANSKDLRTAFEEHLEQTRGHVVSDPAASLDRPDPVWPPAGIAQQGLVAGPVGGEPAVTVHSCRAGRATLLRAAQTPLEPLPALKAPGLRRPHESHTTSVGSRCESDNPGASTEPRQTPVMEQQNK